MKTWKKIAIVVAIVAITTRPAESADAVNQLWTALFSEGGGALDGLFTFIGEL